MKIINKDIVYYVYAIFNTIDGKYYIGQTKDLEERFSKHKNGTGSKLLKLAINKHGIANFVFSIILKINEENIDAAESYWISYFKTTDREFGYNLESGGNKHKHLSQSTKDKLSAINMGKKLSEETKNKMSISRKGRKNSDETRSKLSNALKGNKNSLGKIVSEETKLKISISNKGRVVSQETKDKISVANKGKISPNKGKSQSSETVAKMLQTKLDRGIGKGSKRALEIAIKNGFKKGNIPQVSFKKGQLPKNTILNEEKVLEIRKLHKNGLSQLKISKMYEVAASTISAIILKTTWKHVKDE